MKKFKIPCDFGDESHPFDLYVGEPCPTFPPLYFQSRWLAEIRSGSIRDEVITSFGKLHKIALDNNVSFEELTMYALGSAAEEKKEEIEKKLPDPDHLSPQQASPPDTKNNTDTDTD